MSDNPKRCSWNRLAYRAYHLAFRLKLINPLTRQILNKIEVSYPRFYKILERKLLKIKNVNHGTTQVFCGTLWSDAPHEDEENPLVSVIVPNYNHEQYLYQRLDSIYGQSYSNIEVILLDDCSTDNSRTILKEYSKKYPDITRCEFNEKNSGKVFLQWNKGISLAKGKYIWIAESDDYCELNFLEKLVPKMKCQSIMISFARSEFVQDGKTVQTTEGYLYDTQFDWSKPFSMTAYHSILRGFAYKNIIPNISSAIIRNIGQISQEITELWKKLSLCGDWIFYLFLIRGGALSYTNETTNYYRLHSASTSLKVQHSTKYYQESRIVSEYIVQNYPVTTETFNKTLDLLKDHFLENGLGTDPNKVADWYDVKEIEKKSNTRKLCIMMCGYSMQIGGGEIFPIHLANALKSKGIIVLYADFNLESYNSKIRHMLRPDIPLITVADYSAIADIVSAYGVDIIHSHHGSVDKIISEFLDKKCKQVITLHGMYESVSDTEASILVNRTINTCSKYAYISDRNLKPFKDRGLYVPEKFVKVNNGLPPDCPSPISRKSLNIPDEAFVLCLVSRARLDKGWLEAAECVLEANKKSKRPIHLILVGSGEAYDQMKHESNKFIHPVGEKDNPREYFSASDMGFLPTRFAGESYPLVIIESLFCGKPVIATNVGEISNQIDDGYGNKAGVLFDLIDGAIPTHTLSEIILKLANDPEQYAHLASLTSKVSEKFNINNVAEEYCRIYNLVLESLNS